MRLLAHNMLACNAKVRDDGRRDGRRARAWAVRGTWPPADRRRGRTRAGDARRWRAIGETRPRARRVGSLGCARDVGLTSARDDDDAEQGVVNGFPLKIVAEETREREADFNAEFLVHMLPKMEWGAFVNAAKEIGAGELPAEIPDDAPTNEEFLRAFHHALLEVHVEEGTLVCPESGRKFPINKGIPNMLLNEDEV